MPTTRTASVPLALLAAAVTGVALAAAGSAPGAARAVPPAPPQGADWPQFRGVHRDGVAAPATLSATWPAAGPPQRWRVPIGEGYSHLAVVDGRIYTLFGGDGKEQVAAYDGATGRRLWATPIDQELLNDQGDGPRSTPTWDAGTLYVQSAQGRLAAVAAASGKILWSHDLVREYGARMPTWGGAASPLVDGDLVLAAVGGTSGRSAMAFDKHGGKQVWAALDERPGYASPIALTAAGQRQVIFFTGSSVSAVAPGDGRLLWQVPWQTSLDVNAATPLFIPPDSLFVSSGYDIGSSVFRIHPGAPDSGRLAVDTVWKSRVLKNQFSSTVLGGAYLYGFDNGTFKCVAAATGEERWKQRGFGQGSVIRSGDQLLVLGENGKLALVDATSDAYREHASFQALTGRSWTGPTLVGTTVYLRNGTTMAAFDLGMQHP